MNADLVSGCLLYLLSISKVHADNTVNLDNFDFVTTSGKRPSSVIEATTNLNFSIYVMRLLVVSVLSTLHDSFVRAYGKPLTESETTTSETKMDMKKYTDSLNGKSSHTFIKASKVPSVLRNVFSNILDKLEKYLIYS